MHFKSLSATVFGLALLLTPTVVPAFAQEQANPTTSQEEVTPSTQESTPSAEEANPTTSTPESTPTEEANPTTSTQESTPTEEANPITSQEEATPSTSESKPSAEEANPTTSQEEATPSTSESTATRSAAAKPKFQLPFYCKQKWRLDTWGHAPALDMVKEPQYGTERAILIAPASGTVNRSFYHTNAGNVIQINHGGGWFTTYLHLQSRAVKVGSKVKMGTVIGKVGKTGPTSNGHPHLHFELGYDSNKDGQASWGYKGSERVKPVFFNGVAYGTKNGQTWRNVVSHNKCN
ncbi:MAG: peptidoglycan DD-metalloendopeptidase family protein [Calothrix sp. FI2-JRJ7]|jgi:murein DD-endopeptidase MepM/ murein hydrolase activator NlpD|nr:peptidoglycan DD-metalloendopeptidase family protein [Calothrix sp. FI2-JRJ7]